MAGKTVFDSQNAQDLLSQVQDFNDSIRGDWSRVLNQWDNLKSVWMDEQFEKFEPLFEKFVETYDNAEKECEQYIDFLQKQIDINEEKKNKLAGRLADL